jgi:glycosyltransferase involved in cell wall biosynthesis
LLRGGKDYDRKTDIWASYDYVLVSSKYTFNWYGKATIPWIHRGLHRGVITPTLTLIYHPVLPLKLPENIETHGNYKINIESQLSKLPNDVINIAYVGSLTIGHNTPAHSAIRLFNKLLNSPQTNEKKINLFIMGKVTPTAQIEQFSINLHGNVTSTIKGKVKLMFAASNEEISNVLNTCLILWDLQYINPQPLPLPTPPFGDPFPVSMLEAMFNGVIPISVNLASITEIITPNFNGFLGLVDDDFIELSLHILSLNDAQRNRFRLNSIKTAHSYGLESFQKCLTVFTKDAIKHDILFELSRKRLNVTLRCSSSFNSN